jgi:ketosteroid isomerase-like protein
MSLDRKQLEERVARIYEVFDSGDMVEYRALFSDEIVWHVPGDNPVSGVYRGPDDYFGTMIGRMAPLDEWSFKLTGIATNQQANAALASVRLIGLRKGKRIDMHGYHMIRLDHHGKIVEGWGFTEDQDTLDDFFS